MKALWVGGLCSMVSIGCSNASGGAGTGDSGGGGPGTDGSGGGSSSGATSPEGGGSGGSSSGSSSGVGTGATSLIGTWDLMTTPLGGTGPVTTVTIGQNSLTVNSPGFTLTATRTGNTLTFTDEQAVGLPGSDVVLTASQTAAAFNAGILPFDLGGSWTMQIAPAGQGTVDTCTLTVSSTEIDGACHSVSRPVIDFTFTTTKMTSAASSLGDFGGTWMNTWVWPGASGGTFPCQLTFTGNSITTCTGNASLSGSPLAGISFTYDGANTVSGAAKGWTEYSAMRR